MISLYLTGAFMKQISKTSALVLLLVSAAIGTTDSFADEPYKTEHAKHFIATTGECLTKVPHNRGAITITSIGTAPSSQEASNIARKAHAKLKSRVKQLDLKDFIAETVEYSVRQDCSYNKMGKTCSGYTARMGTRFETSEIPRLGDIIRESSEASADESSTLETFPSSETIKSARQKCLEQAMQNAANKAKKMAEGAQVQLGGLLYAREDTPPSLGMPTPLRGRGTMELAMSAASELKEPLVESKPLEMRITVTSHYEIIR